VRVRVRMRVRVRVRVGVRERVRVRVRVRLRARAGLPCERELRMVPSLLLRRALPAGREVAPRMRQLLRLPPQPRVQALRRHRVDARLEVELR